MASVRSFHRYRGESSFKMSQFIQILKEQIPLLVRSQTRYRVTELPNERTIRFYTANHLVDKPVSGCGSHGYYGYRHLLQVLAIKYLQSQYLPLVKIRSLVENISNRDLELIIPEVSPGVAAHRGIVREDRPIVENAFLQQAIPFNSLRSERGPADPAIDGIVADDTWRRIEVCPGIELHVHAAALQEKDVHLLRGALLRELGILRGWLGDGKE